MIVLALETATPRAACALGDEAGVRAAFSAEAGRRHAEVLVPAIRFCCEQAQVEVGDIGAVAVDVGPGLFTGLRVGVAAARAMARALGVPATGRSSLDLIAHRLGASARTIVPVIDARRGEVFWSTYAPAPDGPQRTSDMRVSAPEDLASELAARKEDLLLAGDGSARYADVLAAAPGVRIAGEGFSAPSAETLLEVVAAPAARGELGRPDELVPLYLRGADTRIKWETRRPPREPAVAEA